MGLATASPTRPHAPPPEGWREFGEARAFVHARWLLSRYDWEAYVRGELADVKGEPPRDIPAAPFYVYRDRGWNGLADWLGLRRQEPAEPWYLPFVKARHFVWKLSLSSPGEWGAYCSGEIEGLPPRPGNVPTDPDRLYSYTWRGWADWLGYQDGAPSGGRWRRFSEAREHARGLGLTNQAEWWRFVRGKLPGHGYLPPDIPANPRRIYHAFGFKGIGDWIGSEQVVGHQRPRLPFEEAREFARTLGLTGRRGWYEWIAGRRPGLPDRPWTIPPHPASFYAGKGFSTWCDFLGSEGRRQKKRTWRSYESAREFARGLGLSMRKEWADYARGGRPDLPPLPADIPREPWTVYGKEYGGHIDFLGKGKIRPKDARPFDQAREFARSLGLSTAAEWKTYVRGGNPGLPPLPVDVPAFPSTVYRRLGWVDFRDWLGTSMRPFEEAREFARRLGLPTGRAWIEWARVGAPGKPSRPRDIPARPEYSYRGKGWTSWGDFLGTGSLGSRNREFAAYFEAAAFAREMGIRSVTEWWAWCRGDLPEKGPRPPNIPAAPDVVYRKRGWHGWTAFLGRRRG